MFKSIVVLLVVSSACGHRGSNQDGFAREALMAHNLYRQIHGAEALRLNSDLCKLALQRAQELASKGQLNVKQNFYEGVNLGETVGSISGFSQYNGISATQFWYSMVAKYDEEGEMSDEAASFTQIVWKSTREVGFGVWQSDDGAFYFVAEYLPSGNIRGQYEANVFQLTDDLTRLSMLSVVSKLGLKKNNTNSTDLSIEGNKLNDEVLKTTREVKTDESLTGMVLTTTGTSTETTTTNKPFMRFTSYANKVWIPKNAGNIDLDSLRLIGPDEAKASGLAAEIIRNDPPASLIFRLTTQNRPRHPQPTQPAETTTFTPVNSSTIFNHTYLITETPGLHNSSNSSSVVSSTRPKMMRKTKKVRVHPNAQSKKSIKRDEGDKDLEKEDDNIDVEMFNNEPDRMKIKLAKRRFSKRQD